MTAAWLANRSSLTFQASFGLPTVARSRFRRAKVGNSVIPLPVLTVSVADGCVKFPRIEGIRLARARLTLPLEREAAATGE